MGDAFLAFSLCQLLQWKRNHTPLNPKLLLNILHQQFSSLANIKPEMWAVLWQNKVSRATGHISATKCWRKQKLCLRNTLCNYNHLLKEIQLTHGESILFSALTEEFERGNLGDGISLGESLPNQCEMMTEIFIHFIPKVRSFPTSYCVKSIFVRFCVYVMWMRYQACLSSYSVESQSERLWVRLPSSSNSFASRSLWGPDTPSSEN